MFNVVEFMRTAAIERPSGDQRGENKPSDPGTMETCLLSRSRMLMTLFASAPPSRTGRIHLRLRLRQFGKTEVQNFDPAALSNEKVLRLKVPVNDAFFVRRRNPMRDLNAIVDCLSHRQRAGLELLARGVAEQQLGDQVGCAREDAEQVNGKNAGMVQGRGRLRFLLKTPQPIGISGNKGWQDLDRHFSFQYRVASAIDLAHPACAQQAENFIAIQFRAWAQVHW
jgi:hypothetical protein